MARFVPELEGKVFPSAAERKVAKRLRAELDDRYVVMHSVGLVRHAVKRWAEADFVIVGPEGVFCLEVKGGRVSRRDGMWSFIDRDDRETLKREGPFDQAGGAAGALAAHLRAEKVTVAGGSKALVGYGVVTPDCLLDALGPGEDPEILLDQRSLDESMSDYIARLGAYWSARLDEAELGPIDVDSVAGAIRGDFEATVVRSARTDQIEEELIRYTEGQRRLMDALATNPRVLVTGAAGTGKTLLALNEAVRLAEDGHGVLLVCSGEGLAADLRERLSDEVIVSTFSELESLSREFDAVVIDEGQDALANRAAVDQLDGLVSGGFTDGRWRFFHDPNQALFGAPDSDTLARLEAGSPVHTRLTVNCRNTERTIEMTRLLSAAEEVAAGDVLGPPVTTCKDWDDPLPQRVAAQLRRLESHGVPKAEVVVLSAGEAARDELASALNLATTSDTLDAVRCFTIREFKGRESPVVVLAGPTTLDTVEGRRLAYVGASRARVEVCVVLPPECRHSYERRSAEFAELMVEIMLRGEA